MRESVPSTEPSATSRTPPAVVHVTHWKAGSQWLHRILHYCCSERVVVPRDSGEHYALAPFRPGAVYPTVYMTRPQFDAVPTQGDVRPFAVIRDLRDTLVSFYFSLRHSHPLDHDRIAQARAQLQTLGIEAGMLWIARSRWFALCADIQTSWLDAGVPILKYEDLLEDDYGLLERVLLDECDLGVDPELLANAVRDCRFANVAGRARGVEDPQSHFRKGVAGDWRNWFTPALRAEFRARFGEVLIRTGYENSEAW